MQRPAARAPLPPLLQLPGETGVFFVFDRSPVASFPSNPSSQAACSNTFRPPSHHTLTRHRRVRQQRDVRRAQHHQRPHPHTGHGDAHRNQRKQPPNHGPAPQARRPPRVRGGARLGGARAGGRAPAPPSRRCVARVAVGRRRPRPQGKLGFGGGRCESDAHGGGEGGRGRGRAPKGALRLSCGCGVFFSPGAHTKTVSPTHLLAENRSVWSTITLLARAQLKPHGCHWRVGSHTTESVFFSLGAHPQKTARPHLCLLKPQRLADDHASGACSLVAFTALTV